MGFHNGNKLRVCINARLLGGNSGGIEQFIIGLAYGLSKLSADTEEFSFYTYLNSDEWLEPYVNSPCELFRSDITLQRLPRIKQVRLSLPLYSKKVMRRIIDGLKNYCHPTAFRQEKFDIIESKFSIVHFPYQSAFETSLPSIYHPWDLQHIHLPQHFSDAERKARDHNYRYYCHQAIKVITTSVWGKHDLVSNLHISEEKIIIVKNAPLLEVYPPITKSEDFKIRQKYNLPDDFIFYPAQTWPHKNHINLLKAVLQIRESHRKTIPVVCTGKKTGYYETIKQFVDQNNLTNQVYFLDFLKPLEIKTIYHLARLLIYPSLFEGGGFPVLEAFWSGLPVACSNVTMLPEITGKSAILFDPQNIEQISNSILLLWNDHLVHREMANRGKSVVSDLTWEDVARKFRAIYRDIVGINLTEEDRFLLVQ